MEIVRLSTVHPALVHFTIGALPLIVIAYGAAAGRRSERWTFAADAALIVTAVLTIATAAFGLVSSAVVPWPGGLALWRWLHLGLGATSVAGLLGFAGVRVWRRRRAATSGVPTFYCALALAAVIGLTGWIGGEVLVFRSGVAVRAAGNGALAPPATRPRTPRDLVDAMDRLRASWASAESSMAEMVVQAPATKEFAAVERDARQMSELARWIAVEGPRSLPDASRPSAHHDEDRESGHEAPMTAGEHLTMMARELGDQTGALERAARARDVTRAAQALGEVRSECAGCHAEMRWAAPPHAVIGSARPSTGGVLGQPF